MIWSPEAWEGATIAAGVFLTIGLLLGRELEARKWREKGLRGYPRMESAGHLYWVNRDDIPCERCAHPEPKP